jgi:hypothetical protein
VAPPCLLRFAEILKVDVPCRGLINMIVTNLSVVLLIGQRT